MHLFLFRYERCCRVCPLNFQTAEVTVGVSEVDGNGHAARKRVIAWWQIRAARLYIEVQMCGASPTCARKRNELPLQYRVTDAHQSAARSDVDVAADRGVGMPNHHPVLMKRGDVEIRKSLFNCDDTAGARGVHRRFQWQCKVDCIQTDATIEGRVMRERLCNSGRLSNSERQHVFRGAVVREY